MMIMIKIMMTLMVHPSAPCNPNTRQGSTQAWVTNLALLHTGAPAAHPPFPPDLRRLAGGRAGSAG